MGGLWGGGMWMAGMRAVTAALLLAVCWTDIREMRIPDALVLCFLVPAALSCLAEPGVSQRQRLIGLICVSLPMELLTRMIPGAFGGGDIKLTGVCGWMLGWKRICLAVWIAIVIGGCAAAIKLAFGKIKPGAHMAFGPYLAVGIWVSMIYGHQILWWYLYGLY